MNPITTGVTIRDLDASTDYQPVVSHVPGRSLDPIRERLAPLKPVVYIDLDLRGTWYNYRRCLEEAHICPCPWLLILEDDAVLCDNFDAILRRILLNAPADIVQLSTWRNRAVETVLRSGGSFLVQSTISCSQGVAYRKETALRILDYWLYTSNPEERNGSDARVSAFCLDNEVDIATALPNPVTHDLTYPSCRGTPAKIGGNYERRSLTFPPSVDESYEGPGVRVPDGRTLHSYARYYFG